MEERKKERTLEVTLDKEDYMAGFLETLNGVAKLTKKERDVFLSFCELQDNDNTLSILSPNNRAIIATKLKQSNYNLTNTISQLKRKGAFLRDKESQQYYLNPFLVPNTSVVKITYIINYI